MRDHALAQALRELGHSVDLAPLYLPLQLDKKNPEGKSPIFFGGINVWLQEKYEIFRKLPPWIDRIFNGRRLLEAVAKRSHLTSAHAQGEMTYLMLALEQSHLEKELAKLIAWIESSDPPDLIILSNALLAGFTRALQEHFQIPVVCTFQGEDSFLDGLPEPWKKKCWEEMALRLQDCDALVSPSKFYAQLMERRLALSEVAVIPNGIDFSSYRTREGEPKYHLGYLARMNELKGLGLLIDAYIHLNDPSVRLAIAGTMSGSDGAYVLEQKAKLNEAGLADQVEWFPDLTLEEKANFLSSLRLFSVPAIYPEAFGLYLIEAMASAVPVVMPRASAFTEIIENAECGLLVEPNSSLALSQALQTLLADPERAQDLGKKGRRAVESHYHQKIMAKNYEALFRKVMEQ